VSQSRNFSLAAAAIDAVQFKANPKERRPRERERGREWERVGESVREKEQSSGRMQIIFKC